MIEQIVAWDGEGFGHPEHKYALLAEYDGQNFAEIWNEDGLRSLSIFDLVWRTGMFHPDATHVLFGASYDWNQWIGDVDLRTAMALHRGHPATVGPFKVTYNGLWFEIERRNFRVTLWDVWRFWGTSFVKAVEDTFPECPDLDLIREGKKQRGEFSAADKDFLIEYNRAELKALVEIVRRMYVYLDKARIRRPNALTGAGAVAGSLLTQHRVIMHNAPLPTEPVAPIQDGVSVYDAALRAYAGGRIEAWKYGRAEKLYVHDIRSAYPRAMLDLPSLAGGEWRWESRFSDVWKDRFSIWRVRWDYAFGGKHRTPTERGYPFFYRDPGGGVLFPASGLGWYCWPEVLVARELGFEFEIDGGWVFEPANDVKPFAWLTERYKQRAKLRDEGEALRAQGLDDEGKMGAQMMVKLGMNAVYGKLCQARGATKDRPPQAQNFAWAAWITSAARAQLLEAASQDWDSVVYMMTDSVASTRRLDLPEGTDLGLWETKEYDEALVVQAGVCFLWKDGKRTEKFRGFDPRAILPERIMEQWKENVNGDKRTPLAVPTSRPVSLGSALSSEDRFPLWNTWEEGSRELDLYGGDGKRWAPVWKDQRPWERLENLRPWGMLTMEDAPDSAPFEPKWADRPSWDKETISGAIRGDREDSANAG